MSSIEGDSESLDKREPESLGLTEFDRKVYASLGKHPQFLHKDFLGYLDRRWLVRPPSLPIGQITGFTQFVPTLASEGTTVTTAETTFTSLTDAGPTLTGLPAGQYVVLIGARASVTASGVEVLITPAVNGTAEDENSASTMAADASHIARASIVTLTESSNSLQAYYRSRNAANTGSWDSRWLLALRFANA